MAEGSWSVPSGSVAVPWASDCKLTACHWGETGWTMANQSNGYWGFHQEMYEDRRWEFGPSDRRSIRRGPSKL